MTTDGHNAPPQIVRLEAGQPHWLDHSDTLWQIREGTVDLYAVTTPDNPRFQQVFLFTAGQGQPLFSLSSAAGNTGIRLMAMSSNGAELKTMARSGLLHNAVRSGHHLFEVIWFMIEEWLEALLSSPNLLAPPRSFLLLASGDTLELAAGQSVRTGRQMLWARQKSGEIRYGRLPTYPIASGMDVPIITQGWLTSLTSAQVSGLSTEEVFPAPETLDNQRYWQPLDQCHQLFTAIIEKYFADEIQRSRERLADKQSRREKLLYSAAAHLLRNDLPDIFQLSMADQTNPPLLLVLRAIAQHLGIAEEQVRLPKAGGDPLRGVALMNRIARLAGMQARKVQLENGWHKQDNGPLLGYFGQDNEPVALLPLSPYQYRIFRPENPLGAELTDQDLAALQADAYTFYVGLAAKSVSLGDWLMFTLKKSWAMDYWVVVLASLIAGMIPMLTPFVTNTIFSDLIPISDRQGHVMVIQVMMVAALASVGVSLTRGVAVIRVKGRSRLAGEAALWLRLLSLPSEFFRRFESGDLALRLNSINQLSTLLSNSLVSTVFNGLLSVFSLLMMFYYSWKLGVTALGILLLYLCLVFFSVLANGWPQTVHDAGLRQGCRTSSPNIERARKIPHAGRRNPGIPLMGGKVRRGMEIQPSCPMVGQLAGNTQRSSAYTVVHAIVLVDHVLAGSRRQRKKPLYLPG